MAGVAVSAVLTYIHSQIDSLGDSYTSFCNINTSINCDKVLSSPFAKLYGIPVAWMGMAAYATLGMLFAAAARQSDPASGRWLRLASVGVIGALTFSAYMAYISLFVVGAICLFCSGLYLVALLLAAATVVAGRRAAGLGKVPLAPMAAAAVLALAVVAVSAVAWATWPRSRTALETLRTAAEVQKADPEFYAWYRALPVVDLRSILPADELAVADSHKVVIVDFFDLECGHCRHNHELLKQIVARHPGEVALIHRHFPLDTTCNEVVPVSLHPNACRAAEATECAALQGKREAMLDILFANQGQLFAENLPRLAARAGLDTGAFKKCLAEHATLPRVLEDCRAGAKLDITSTPTIFVQGRRIQGTFDTADKYDMAIAIESDSASRGTVAK